MLAAMITFEPSVNAALGDNRMTLTIDAIYADGVLKPLTPLHLAENQRVTIQVVAQPQISPKPNPADVTFKGIWPLEMTDDLEQALAEIRTQTNQRLEQLANDLEEALRA
jgi:predicted DNA-binding antitoxin AbrB/MazE fold protein